MIFRGLCDSGQYLFEVVFFILTLPKTACLRGQSRPGPLHDGVQDVSVVPKLCQCLTGRVLGEAVCPDPVQVTADPPGHVLQHALGEALLPGMPHIINFLRSFMIQ